MFTRNWAKILPAVTAISTFAITSAFALGSHPGNPGGGGGGHGSTGTTTLTPAVCLFPAGDDDASAAFVSLSSGSHNRGNNLALELATFDDDDDSVAYGIVANSAFPTWQQIQFDVSVNADGESFLEVLGNNPLGFFNVQGIDIVDLPLAATQPHDSADFVTLVATSAYLSANRVFGGPFFAGATFLSADIGQGSDGNTILVQNVSLNGGSVATNVLVTAAQNCSTIF